MDFSLIEGKTLAEALGRSPSAVSMAAKEGRECAGRPVHKWVRRGEDGSARGYAVPAGVRLELRLPPFEGLSAERSSSEGSSPDSSEEGPPDEFSETGAEKQPEGSNRQGDGGEEVMGEKAVGELAQWYTTAIAAQVAFRIYEEMGPLLREAIRARMEAGDWPPGWAEAFAGEKERAASGEGPFPEEKPSESASSQGPPESDKARGEEAPGEEASPEISISVPARSIQSSGATSEAEDSSDPSPEGSVGEESERSGPEGGEEEEETTPASAALEAILEEATLERDPDEPLDSFGEGPLGRLEAYGAALRRRAERDGKIAPVGEDVVETLAWLGRS